MAERLVSLHTTRHRLHIHLKRGNRKEPEILIVEARRAYLKDQRPRRVIFLETRQITLDFFLAEVGSRMVIELIEDCLQFRYN